VLGSSDTTKKGKAPVLDVTEARQLLDSIDVTTPIRLRNRALIELMVFSFARVGAALAMRVDDVYVQQRRLSVRLREKAANSTRCRVITRWRCTCTRIWNRPACAMNRRVRCSARSHAAPRS
jgi:site-specific recombinase XerD